MDHQAKLSSNNKHDIYLWNVIDQNWNILRMFKINLYDCRNGFDRNTIRADWIQNMNDVLGRNVQFNCIELNRRFTLNKTISQ